ncbi:MAG TPA: hypothetical protein VID27_06110 [Blastocatellia bacterium]|jgi:hypothetical protein
MSDWKQEQIAKLIDEYGDVPPPWVAFPDTHPYSICWRMGAGESHIMVWSDWWESQHFNEEERIEYFRKWQPPARWLEWMIDAVWEIRLRGHEEDFDYAPYFARVEKLGFGSKEDYEKDIEDPRWISANF